MANCIVPGCPREAYDNLGVRLRRPDTSAIWAPNTEAFVCAQHAVSGARISIYYEATETGGVEINVRGATPEVSRLTSISQEVSPAETLTTRVRDQIGGDET